MAGSTGAGRHDAATRSGKRSVSASKPGRSASGAHSGAGPGEAPSPTGTSVVTARAGAPARRRLDQPDRALDLLLGDVEPGREADDAGAVPGRLEPVEPLRPHVQAARARGAEQPLLTGERVVVDAERRDVDRHGAGRLRAVDRDGYAALVAEPDQRLDLVQRPGRPGHVRERDELRALV